MNRLIRQFQFNEARDLEHKRGIAKLKISDVGQIDPKHYWQHMIFDKSIAEKEQTQAMEALEQKRGTMSEDAYNGKKILIFDDINDSGKTLQWIKSDWRASTYPADPKWQNDMIFGNNVKTACLIENTGSEFEVDYVGDIVNKIDDPQWVVFPWEEWWNLPTF